MSQNIIKKNGVNKCDYYVNNHYGSGTTSRRHLAYYFRCLFMKHLNALLICCTIALGLADDDFSSLVTLGCVECGTFEGNLTVDNFVLVCPTSIQTKIPLAPNSNPPLLSQDYPAEATAVICNAYATNPTTLQQWGLVILERCAIAATLAAVEKSYQGPESVAEAFIYGCGKQIVQALLSNGISLAHSALAGAAAVGSAVSGAANTAAGAVSGAASTATQGAGNVANSAAGSVSNTASSAAQGASNTASSAVQGVSSAFKIPGKSLATRNSGTVAEYCLVVAAVVMVM